MYKLKVPIRDKCPTCEGKTCLPVGQALNNRGEPYTRYVTCATCNGIGGVTRWIDLAEFAVLLQKAACPHEHITRTGGVHFSAGEVWDDIEEVCDDCDLNLDRSS